MNIQGVNPSRRHSINIIIGSYDPFAPDSRKLNVINLSFKLFVFVGIIIDMCQD